jgi:hypothetical protein
MRVQNDLMAGTVQIGGQRVADRVPTRFADMEKMNALDFDGTAGGLSRRGGAGQPR